jgi:hypothetical protein
MGLDELILIAHSFTRWSVLVLSLVAALTALAGWAVGRDFLARDRAVARLFVASVDLQLLLGLTLYFGVSPLARAARTVWSSLGFSALWADPELRFIGVIHPALALLAAFVAHAGWVAARRTDRPGERHARVAVAAAVALAIFLAAVPWPFLGHERPWVRF